jgi:hypothetical protein
MGLEDRDYYKDWQAEKEGRVNKPKLRLNLRQIIFMNMVNTATRRVKSWHPLLGFLATFFFAVGLILLFWLIVRILGLLF